jgi:hypothetical protein
LRETDPIAGDAQPESDGQSADREQRDFRLIRFAYRAITADLWLRTGILTIVSTALIAVSFRLGVISHPGIWSFLASQLGTGLLVGAVGAALFQSIIMSSPDKFRKLMDDLRAEARNASNGHTSTQLELIKSATTEGMRSLEGQVSQLRADLQRHDMRSVVPGDEALDAAGVAALYPVGDDAMTGMMASLKDPRVMSVRLMGLSLSDWFGTRRLSYGSELPIQLLEEVLCGGAAPRHPGPMRLQVLLLDPHCAAAQLLLRKRAERDADGRPSRFEEETARSARRFIRLQETLGRFKNGNSVEVRFYRAIPSSFMLITDVGSFVRPYYAALDTSRTGVPVLEYRCDSMTHAAARDHFDSIWQYASLKPESILAENSHGTDEGTSRAGMENIYTDLRGTQDRITWLLDHARDRVWMQGISLVHHVGTELIDYVAKVVHKNGVDTRFLILDPDCEEAYRKSYRDYLLDHASNGSRLLSFEQYKSDRSLHEKSAVYRNIMYTTQIFSGIISGASPGSARLHHYTCAPTSYVLIADDYAMVEQFHYGKSPSAIDSAGTRLQLAREMPLVELRRPQSKLYRTQRNFDPHASNDRSL